MSANAEPTPELRVDPRAVAITALLVVAMGAVALLVERPARETVLLALAYVLSFRLVLLAYSGRRRNPFVVLAVPVVGGALIGLWWAVPLCLVNGALALAFGVRRDVPRDPLSRREISIFVAAEAALLAAGVGVGQWVRA